MSARWKLEVTLTMPLVWLSLSTPDPSVTNPALRSRLWPPAWELHDYSPDAPAESRYWLFLTWFFHLTLAWGRPAAVTVNFDSPPAPAVDVMPSPRA